MPWVLVECPLDITLDTQTHAVVVHAGEEYFFILVQYSLKATTKFLGVFRGIQASSPYLHGACSRPRRRRILVGPAVQGGGARTSAYRAAYQQRAGALDMLQARFGANFMRAVHGSAPSHAPSTHEKIPKAATRPLPFWT